MNHKNTAPERAAQERNGILTLLYRHRWSASVGLLFLAVLALGLGVSRIVDFSRRVDSLAEQTPKEQKPKLFDMRSDIWFDPNDEGLSAYRDVEAQFIAEDVVIVAFEEKDDPMGVFGTESLELIEQLTAELERIPFVRNVRSLTSTPWIRNGSIDGEERGLIVSDLFDDPVSTFTPEQRLERMIAVLGAERAAALVGAPKVRALLGEDANWKDHQGEPRFIDAIVSRDGRSAAIVLQIVRQKPDPGQVAAVFPDDDADRNLGAALFTIEAQGSAVQKVVERLRKKSGRQMYITGIPVIERHFPEVGQQDMAWLGLMFLVIGAVLYLIYRKITGVLLPLAVVLFSIFTMNGVVWWKGDLINNLTASAPIIMTAVGIADAVHLVTAYFLLRDDYQDKKSLLLAVLRKNALPVFLTSLTTVIAFLSLTVSAIIPVRQLGYTAAIGTAFAYVLSMTLVPAALSLLPLKTGTGAASEKAPTPKRAPFTDGLARFVERRRTPLILSTIFVLALAGVGVGKLRVESDLRQMFPSDDAVVRDQNWIEAHLGGAGDLDIVFRGRKSDDSGRIAVKHEFLSHLDAFERRLVSESLDPHSPLAVITSIDSGLSVLRRMHQVQNDDSTSYYRVPSEKDVPAEARKTQILVDPFTGERSVVPPQNASTLSAQYYLQYENGAKPAENLAPFVSPDRRSLRLAARVTGRSSADMLKAYERIRKIAAEEFPTIAGSSEQVDTGVAQSTMRMTGKHYLFMNMMERFTDTLVYSLALALLTITLVIGFVFRSLRVALISMVPNVLPLVVPLALFGLLGIALDGPAVIVATIALGICVDDTIHLLTKFQAEKALGRSTREAIQAAFRQVGAAITWTTITLVLGFSVLSLSAFRPNMLIGVLGATMVALAWVCDMVLTPALLGLVFADAPQEASSTVQDASPEPAQ